MTTLAAAFFAGFLLAAALYELELKRWAKTLGQEGEESLLAGIVLRYSTRGWIALRDSLASVAGVARKAERAQRLENQDYLRGLSALSHDMRTPLAGAKGYIQLAGMEDLPDVAVARLDGAARRIDDAEALLDQLSAFARAKDPERSYSMERVALLPLVIEVLGGYEPELVARGWDVDVAFDDEARCVIADPAALRRVVDNLISNALKYGAKDLSISQTNVGGWRLSISNTLCVNSDFDPQRVFDRAWRAPSAGEQPGLGLGLSIARSLTKDMRMDLTARREGERATFELCSSASSAASPADP